MADINGTNGSETLTGTDDNDSIKPGNGDDTVYGGAGDDLINAMYSVEGQLSHFNYAGTLTAYGGAGNDVIGGKSGNDTIYGGAGDDELYGLSGDNTLNGEDGDDYLLVYGFGGDNFLSGGPGNDELHGGSGNDVLEGGPGFDILYGNKGGDTYILKDTEFYIWDSDGSDIANVYVSFLKIPSSIETINYFDGALPLPYWIDALIPDWGNGSRFRVFLGKGKTFGYTFPESIPIYDLNENHALGYKAFSQEQKANVIELLDHIEELIDVSFDPIDNASAQNVLSFAMNNQGEGSGGYANAPDEEFSGSDVFLNDEEFNRTLNQGTGGAHILTHEVAHALGLKHPHSEEGALGISSDPPYLPELENTKKWTQMSYTNSDDYNANVLELSPLDIAALQYLYGPNPNSRSGDDTYVFDSENPNFIWDGSGTDTIDASGAPDSVTIFLTPGYHGFIGRTKKYELITSPGQITVNFGTEIENLKGSAFADVLTGNHLNNVIEGLAGSDTVDGKEGIDTAVFSGNKSDYSWAMFVVDPHPESGLEPWYGWSVGEDSLRNIERLQFDDTNIALDLDGHAGEAVKTLGAFLGASGITPENVGLVINLLDNGLTYEGLLAEANAVVFGADPDGATMVRHFYTALTGEEAPADVISQYGGMVDNGELSRLELAKLVADYEVNLTNIDLVGLSTTGVEYLLG